MASFKLQCRYENLSSNSCGRTMPIFFIYILSRFICVKKLSFEILYLNFLWRIFYSANRKEVCVRTGLWLVFAYYLHWRGSFGANISRNAKCKVSRYNSIGCVYCRQRAAINMTLSRNPRSAYAYVRWWFFGWQRSVLGQRGATCVGRTNIGLFCHPPTQGVCAWQWKWNWKWNF